MSRSSGGRRYFWGGSLPQALMAAARFHCLPPDEVAYRVFEKRHGFLRNPRRVVIIVDPDFPQGRSATSPPARSESAPRAAAAEPARAGSDDLTMRQPEPAPRGGSGVAAERPRGRSIQQEAFVPPDEESRLAAAVAIGRLLRLAGLEMEASIEAQPERLEIRLEGSNEARLQRLGSGLLDDLDHLLPRLIKGLSGRFVRCRIDGAGLRGAREEELRALAVEAARRVAQSGEAVILEALPASERRLVHLALAEDPSVATESLGDGALKPVRVYPIKP